jgi:hypothetical protein
MSLAPLYVLTAVVFSTAVDLFFGYHPPRRTSRLLPIVRLRQD